MFEKIKASLLNEISYTELVYGRVNKKLSTNFSNKEIENLIFDTIKETDETSFERKGKNIYVTNSKRNIILTINSFTNRLITVNKLH